LRFNVARGKSLAIAVAAMNTSQDAAFLCGVVLFGEQRATHATKLRYGFRQKIIGQLFPCSRMKNEKTDQLFSGESLIVSNSRRHEYLRKNGQFSVALIGCDCKPGDLQSP